MREFFELLNEYPGTAIAVSWVIYLWLGQLKKIKEKQ